MFAATSPTCCLSMPSTLNTVGRSTENLMPSGAVTNTGCEKPRANSRSCPLACTRYPVPAISRVFLYPSVTPTIMLATRVRDSPCSSLARRSSLGRFTLSVPSSARSAVIGSARVCASSPLGPFTRISCPVMVMSTPAGTGIGLRPMRDMVSLPLPDPGEDFPAHVSLTGLPVGQQPLGRRDDGDAQAAQHAGQLRGLGVDPQAGLGHPADAGEAALTARAVLQLDGQHLADSALGRVLHGPVGDVPLGLEDLGDVRLDLRVGHRH